MKPEVLVSIIIPTYNRQEILRQALQSLVCQETDSHFSYEIIVIDDGSTDKTSLVVQEIMNQSQVPVRYVCEEGRGYSYALNRGIRESTGKWMAFFDDDQLAEADWLKNLCAIALETGAECVGGSIHLLVEGKDPLVIGAVTRSILGEHIFSGNARPFDGKELPSGGNMLIARRVFDAIGLFDTSMSAGSDSDLIIRALGFGFKVWIVPNSIIHHLIPSYRLKEDYFRWVSLRWGSEFAYSDCKIFGRRRMLTFGIARIGQAFWINMPKLLLAYLSNDKAKVRDLSCLLWRALGYVKKCLSVIAPKLLHQRRFFDSLDFRGGRRFQSDC